MLGIPIRYFVVGESSFKAHATVVHLLDAAEIPLLRCFMALLFLPSHAADFVPEQPPFTAAMNRLHLLPSFRKLRANLDPPTLFWETVARDPFVIIMVGSALPDWIERAA